MQDSNTNISDENFARSSENFGFKLFFEVGKANARKNIIFSPFSLQTCLAMARVGAAGETAAEMDRAMGFPQMKEEALADKYYDILSKYANSKILKIANKIYVMKGYSLKPNYNELLANKFLSAAENINFSQNIQAAKDINSWVESKTNRLITDIISPNLLSGDTRMVLLNAIHFKGNWVIPFPETGTRDKDFHLDDRNDVKVKMMRVNGKFRYGEFEHLDATALEMRYKDSDLSMLVLLPKSRNGLAQMEEKLKTISLNELVKRMYTTEVIVDFPKFRSEFSVTLNDALQKLGMRRMFSGDANFSRMLQSSENLSISTVVHKAFIEVNEIGTEAAASTGMGVAMMTSVSIGPIRPPKIFNADHPFYYFLKNSKGIYLIQGSQISFR
ncbi:antichymotrypsin-2-like [Stomoxys calcitrans]|uniref:antichymotrypsin-2-like n=1 Tax=Stomoxys calcitrans TaxID=35570 RepID=UPI0027E367CA|nr:antichymotrypsin-2-like [Stomoxys calcitrans]